jgi:presenilin-like A22 family membrane protease
MGVLHLIGALLMIGFALWVLNFLLGKYIQPWILDLINKVAIVAAVALVFFWVLSLFGVPMPFLERIRW